MGLLSPEEKIYIVHGAEQNVRCDGRSKLQYRPLELEVGIMPSAMGSARVRIGLTDVIACVKANTFTPPAENPAEGKLELLVHFSGVADPENEGRTSEHLREEFSNIFNKLYSSIKLKDWCIVEKLKCWKFNVDICVVSLDGNLFDAVGLAVKSALADTVLPVVRAIQKDKGEIEFTITDDPGDSWTPNIEEFPIFVSISKMGNALIIDPTAQEEQCCSFNCVAALTQSGKCLYTMKIGAGSLHPSTLAKVMSEIRSIGVRMNRELTLLLNKSKKCKETVGYL